MNFQTEYATAMERLHASEETIKEVRRMNRTTYETGGKRKLLRPVWIVAALLAFCTVALAATYKLWSPGLTSHFGADEAAQDALLDSGMTSLVDAEPVTMENGLTLEVQQVLCDGQEITISVRYSAPESGWFTWDNQGWATQFTHPVLTIGDTDFGPGGGGFENETVTDTEAYMTWSFLGDCAALDGETMTLTLITPPRLSEMLDDFEANFDTINGAEDEAIIRNDPLILWEPVTLSWTLDMATSIGKELEGSFSGVYNDETITIEDVRLTPLSIRFTVTEGLDTVEALYPTGIVLTDGTTVGFTSGHLGEIDAVPEGFEPDMLPGYYTFDTTILDLDSIAGITFAAWANTPVDPEVGDITVFTLPLK